MRQHLLAKKTAFIIALAIAVISNTAIYTPNTGLGSGRFIAGKNPTNTITANINGVSVDRERALIMFLKKYNSPLIDQAPAFIEIADKYNLDWRLLPAIAGMESTFGRFLIEQTHNPFGWGGGYIYFDSYEEGIETVGRELARRFKEHTSPEEIGPTYTPPNYANWIKGVNFFMHELASTKPVTPPIFPDPLTFNSLKYFPAPIL